MFKLNKTNYLLLVDYLDLIMDSIRTDKIDLIKYDKIQQQIVKLKEKEEQILTDKSNDQLSILNELYQKYTGNKDLLTNFINLCAEHNKTGKLTVNREINILSKLIETVEKEQINYESINQGIKVCLEKGIIAIPYLKVVAKSYFKNNYSENKITTTNNDYLETIWKER